jgi:hypothetical protein
MDPCSLHWRYSEIGTTLFSVDSRRYRSMTPDPSLVLFYNYKTWRTFLETKVIPKTDSFKIAHADIEPKFNYVYNLDGELYQDILWPLQ